MDLLYENGNGLAVFSFDPEEPHRGGESEALLAEFTENTGPENSSKGIRHEFTGEDPESVEEGGA